MKKEGIIKNKLLGMYMWKRGIPNILLAVLLVISSFFVFYTYFNKTIKESKEEDSVGLTCLTDVDLSLVSSCYEENIIKILVKNNKNFEYNSNFFIIKINKNNELKTIPTIPNLVIKGFEQKEILVNVDDPEEISEVILIPRIEKEKSVYCSGNVIKFKPRHCD